MKFKKAFAKAVLPLRSILFFHNEFSDNAHELDTGTLSIFFEYAVGHRL
jgi:hypothetical protein